MPTGKLVFKLPEEEPEFRTAQASSTLVAFLHSFHEYLHRRYKHAEPKSEAHQEEYEEIRAEFQRLCDEYGVDDILWS